MVATEANEYLNPNQLLSQFAAEQSTFLLEGTISSCLFLIPNHIVGGTLPWTLPWQLILNLL